MTNIKVITSEDPSERSFQNEEYEATCYQSIDYRIGVVWEYVKIRGTKLLTFHDVKIWASNGFVSDEEHSQVGMFGVVGQNAYPLGLKNVGKHAVMYTFFQEGEPTGDYPVYFSLHEYDSIFLCVRAPAFKNWKAASQGFDVSYSWDWGELLDSECCKYFSRLEVNNLRVGCG